LKVHSKQIGQIKEFTYTYTEHSATITQKKSNYYSLSVFLNASAIFPIANKEQEGTMTSTAWKMRLKDSPQVIQEYQKDCKKVFLIAVSRQETKLTYALSSRLSPVACS